MERVDIVGEAARVVEDYLRLIESVAAIRSFREEHQSRLICRCRSCNHVHLSTLLWVQRMRLAEPLTTAPPPAAIPAAAGRAFV